MNIILLSVFIILRLIIIGLAILLGYYVVKKIIEPYLLKPACLTDSNSCAYLTIWKYQNSFIAQVFPSELFIWFNGARLYVYGEASGECQDKANYEAVDVIDISGTNDNAIYTRQNYECITKASTVINYYVGVLKVDPITIYIRGSSPTQEANLNVFDIFQRLVDQSIVSVNNIASNNHQASKLTGTQKRDRIQRVSLPDYRKSNTLKAEKSAQLNKLELSELNWN